MLKIKKHKFNSSSVFCLPLSSPLWLRCWLCFSGTRWRTGRSDWLPSMRCCCPSCTRWLTAPLQAAGASYRPRLCLSPPPPSRCPNPPRRQSSVPGLPSRWTSCRQRPSLSCSSRSSAFSQSWRTTTGRPGHWRDDKRQKWGLIEFFNRTKHQSSWALRFLHRRTLHWPSF